MLVVRTGWRALCSTVCKWYIALFFSSLGGALVLALILMAVDPDASSTAVCNEKGRDPEECDPDFGMTFYWAVATIGTVGYGDVTPHNQASRAVIGVVVVLFFPWYAIMSGTVASALITQKVSRDEPTLLGLAPPPRRRRVVLRTLRALLPCALLFCLFWALALLAIAPEFSNYMNVDDQWKRTASRGSRLCSLLHARHVRRRRLRRGYPSERRGRMITALFILCCVPLYPITIGFVTSELIDQRVIQAGKGEVELQERVSGGAFDGLISTPAGAGAE